MPEFRGKKTTNEVLASKPAAKWKSVTLNRTSVDDQGMIDLCHRAPNLTELHIISDLITDESMPAMCSLPNLRSLLFNGVPHVSDRGIANISRIADLRELYLKGTRLTDNGVSAFTSATSLWSLCLAETQLSDAGVLRLGDGPRLLGLRLSKNRISGSTLANLNLDDRVSLYLAECPIGDAAVQKLAEAHPKIETLDLSGTLITDACLSALAALPGLCEIQLTGTSISDAGLARFHRHPLLSMIYLANTRVTPKGVASLRSSFDRHVSIYES